MVRKLTDIKIEAYAPGKSTPHTTITDNILRVELSERISDAKDTGQIELDATDSGFRDLTAGDRLELYTQLAGEASLTHRWTGLARSPADILDGGDLKRREINAVDFVFGVLADRIAFDNFEGRQIAGESDAILDTLLAEEAPEIGRSQISTVSETTDLFIDGRSLYSVVAEDLAPLADAVVSQDGTDITFDPLDAVTATAGITPDDLYAPITVKQNDDNLVNQVRVSGGTDHAVDDSQTTQSSTATVTNSSRLTTQIQTRKSEVDRVDIYTDPDPNSDDELRVRLQATRSGAAVEPTDTSSDIARKSLAPEFLADDGFTTFLLPSHTLAPGETPTLIVDADGSTGHAVGTDGSGTPTYKASFPFPLLTRAFDQQSIDEYRRRDRRIEDESLDTITAVRDKSQSILARRAEPETTVQAQAASVTAHNLDVGDAASMQEFGSVNVAGDYIVRERTTEIDGTLLRTDLTLQEAATV